MIATITASAYRNRGLSVELGTPNTCNQCHTDRDAAWAVAALQDWGVSPKIRATHAPVMARAQSGDASVFPQLMKLATEPGRAAIIRATATLALGDFPSQETLQVIQSQLSAEDELVRAAAVRSLDMMQAAQRYSLLQPLIGDPVKSVRMEVARQLSELPVAQLPPEYAGELNTLRKEYLEALKLNSDMPEAQMNLGIYYTATGDSLAAEAAYRQAIRLSPAFVPAMLNLADLYRANDMDAQARPLIEKAMEMAPADPAAPSRNGSAAGQAGTTGSGRSLPGKSRGTGPSEQPLCLCLRGCPLREWTAKAGRRSTGGCIGKSARIP